MPGHLPTAPTNYIQQRPKLVHVGTHTSVLQLLTLLITINHIKGEEKGRS